MVVVLFEHPFHYFELVTPDGFEHVFSIACVVEETARLATATELRERLKISIEHKTEDVGWP